MSDYGMNPTQVLGYADDMDQQNGSMTTHITDMMGDLDKAVQNWNGDSKSYYVDARKRWTDQMFEMSGDLGEASNVIRYIVELILNNEKNVGGMF